MTVEIKIVLVGIGGVGKSAITINYVSQVYTSEYDPTIEDSHRKQVLIDDEVNVLDILDTAGQEEYKIMQDQWFRSGEGFVVVYSVDDRKSFDDVNKLVDKVYQIHETSPYPPPIVLVGNKCDLPSQLRQVSEEEGEMLARKLGCSFFETSAKEHINIEECFSHLVREVRKKRNLISDPSKEKEKNVVEVTPKSKKKGKKQCIIL